MLPICPFRNECVSKFIRGPELPALFHLFRASCVSKLVCLRSYACLSGRVLLSFILMVFVFCLSLCCQDKTDFTMLLLCILPLLIPFVPVPLVSYLVLLLSQINMLSVATKAIPCGLRSCLRFMVFSSDMDRKLPASGASITTNKHTNAAMAMNLIVWGLQGCNCPSAKLQSWPSLHVSIISTVLSSRCQCSLNHWSNFP